MRLRILACLTISSTIWDGKRSLLNGFPDAESNWFCNEFPAVDESERADKIPWLDDADPDILKLSKLDWCCKFPLPLPLLLLPLIEFELNMLWLFWEPDKLELDWCWSELNVW